MRPVVNINPDMLIWAIDRAGFDLQELSSKNSNLKKWINGEKNQLLSNLRSFPKKSISPLVTFFLRTSFRNNTYS